jgi:phosphomevalonate kinase
VIAVAPGKVVLLGEYAVVDGAPALVAAVDAGVVCRVSAGPFEIRTPTGDDRFVRAALEHVGAPPAIYAFSDARVFGIDGKPGLGGSAAATVAACLAGSARAGRPLTGDALRDVAIGVHRDVQGGGSGIDVAAAAHGGVVRFEAGRVTAAREVRPVVVWSGASASTSSRVRVYQAWPDRARFVDASRALVDAFDDDPLGALRAAWRLLVAMSSSAKLDYRTATLDRIVALAEDRGGAAKPSGAGGGDVAVALFPDPESETSFRDACRQEGLPPLDVALAGPPTLDPAG